MLIVILLESLELGLIYSILALGVFLSFRTLNTPDLTVDGSIVTGAAISAVICTAAADMSPAMQGLMCVLALVASFILGMGAGAITALLNTKLKIQPLLAGILVMLGIYSINLRIQGKANVNLNNVPTIYRKVGDLMNGFQWSSIVLGVIMAAVIIILLYGFLKTRKGFALRATGDNEEMVRSYGISSDNMKLLGLSVSNGLVGMTGGMLAQYTGLFRRRHGRWHGGHRSGVGNNRRSDFRYQQPYEKTHSGGAGSCAVQDGHSDSTLYRYAADRSEARIGSYRYHRTVHGYAG